MKKRTLFITRFARTVRVRLCCGKYLNFTNMKKRYFILFTLIFILFFQNDLLSHIFHKFIYNFSQVTGQWKGITAGGCGNHPTYMNNPRYQIVLESSNNNNYLLIILKGPKQYQIGFDINTIVLNDSNAPTAFKTKSSGPFRSVSSLIFVPRLFRS